MTYKDKILKFVTAKDKYIQEIVGIEYVTKDDIAEIGADWSEELCEEIWNEMLIIDEISSCPWCVKREVYNSRYCDSCGYGERHGKCSITNEQNTYHKIKTEAERIGIPDLLYSDKINDIFTSIRFMD